MTQTQILILLNTAMLATLVVIAFRLSQGYNIFVKQGANHTTAPSRVDTIEVQIPLNEVRLQCAVWKQAGYQVVRSKGSQRGMLTLVMTKTLNGRNTI